VNTGNGTRSLGAFDLEEGIQINLNLGVNADVVTLLRDFYEIPWIKALVGNPKALAKAIEICALERTANQILNCQVNGPGNVRQGFWAACGRESLSLKSDGTDTTLVLSGAEVECPGLAQAGNPFRYGGYWGLNSCVYPGTEDKVSILIYSGEAPFSGDLTDGDWLEVRVQGGRYLAFGDPWDTAIQLFNCVGEGAQEEAIPSGNPGPSPTAPQHRVGLGDGAIAGIAVGGVTFAALSTLAAFLCGRRIGARGEFETVGGPSITMSML
jgi:hypothetical protein